MTLTEFLLARIAEDEARLPEGFDCWYPPERYSAECEAKRRIVELHTDCGCNEDMDGIVWAAGPCSTIRTLALPYAEHPEFQEAWRV